MAEFTVSEVINGDLLKSERAGNRKKRDVILFVPVVI